MDNDGDGTTDFASIYGCEESVNSVTVPDVLGGYPVKEIAQSAFANCQIESVTLPDSLTSIGYQAFWNCSKLKNINIPQSVVDVDDAFYGTAIYTEQSTQLTGDKYIYVGDWVVGCKGGDGNFVPSDKKVRGFASGSMSHCSDAEIKVNADIICSGAFIDCQAEDFYILNPYCDIFDSGSTICNEHGYIPGEGPGNFVFNGTIYGYTNSTAQKYAEKYGYKFKSLGDIPGEDFVNGDVSGNGEVDLQDVIIISKYLLHKVEFTPQQQKAADFNGDGVVDLQDAIAIAKYILKH